MPGFNSNDEAKNIKNQINQALTTDYSLPGERKQKQHIVLDADLDQYISDKDGITNQLIEGMTILTAYGLLGQLTRGFMTVLDVNTLSITYATPATLVISFTLALIIIISLVIIAMTSGDSVRLTSRVVLMFLGFILGVY